MINTHKGDVLLKDNRTVSVDVKKGLNVLQIYFNGMLHCGLYMPNVEFINAHYSKYTDGRNEYYIEILMKSGAKTHLTYEKRELWEMVLSVFTVVPIHMESRINADI